MRGPAYDSTEAALRRAFGDRIAGLRRGRHLTQRELAEKLGVASLIPAYFAVIDSLKSSTLTIRRYGFNR